MSLNHLNEQDLHYLASLVDTARCSTGESALNTHSRDQSRHRPVRPEVVIWPQSTEEVVAILTYANERRLPVTGWGSGSSLEGNPIPVCGGIVLSFGYMNKILSVRPDDFQIDVQPGVVYKEMNHELRHSGLFFPPDPGAGATIGGMIANNASGTRTVRYGSTKDYVQRLTVVLADGEVIELGNRASKSSSGYDLLHLFVGSEGMLGIVTEATLRLAPIQEEFAWAVATFSSVEAASRTVLDVMRSGINPAAIELLAPECIEVINRCKGFDLTVSPTLFVEMHGASTVHLSEAMDLLQVLCGDQGGIDFRPGLDRAERDRLIEARHSLGEMIRQVHKDQHRIVIDVAVPISAYPEMIAFAREAAGEAAGTTAYIFGHAGDGNIHLVVGAKPDDALAWQAIDRLNQRMVMKALEMDGTATGEHGVGIGKRKFMPAEHGHSLAWMKKVKTLFDPNGILNPGKMFPD
ncbi:FAD-binding oxidoreductase [Desulfatitalea tepidiphila]|uniref:FAD-binding oxidoreductase n=1 Tax=Desulfatitalea tepidiphila TaxID=1185843 RepID=UPI0006B668A5|nr:FAD-binding oxidoreductase [Desulfatitalea tepidiphila]